MAGQALLDQRVGLRVLGHAAGGGQALQEIVEKLLFLGSHGCYLVVVGDGLVRARKLPSMRAADDIKATLPSVGLRAFSSTRTCAR
ncbi:hypothetical protein GCM10009429_16410 [Dyella marensis]